MPSISSIAYYLTHPGELRSIVQWTVWHEAVHERDESKESANLKECFRLLKLTSRSFAAVIQELHPELLVPVCLFYLILRGLDTIEDDMTIPISKKEPLLRQFDQILDDPTWTFTENGPNEKDRELLVKFDVVGREFSEVKEAYKVIIRDITKRMGNGMADYAKNAEHLEKGVDTIKDYELYCHYVAGLVGEGLTRLFVEAGLANPVLLKRPELMESMGQFLQQTNIIRDIREDHDDKRYFWPRQVWSKYVNSLPEIFLPENKEKALQCQSEMVLLALQRAEDCLFYMAGVKEQSVFNFVAIPQAMAIATLELCFQNYKVFERNVKITKGDACSLMWQSTQNLQLVCEVFRKYARKIHAKNKPTDPNFMDISIACGKIERFIETIFPSQTAKTLSAANGAPVEAAQSQAAAPVVPLTAEEQAAKKKDEAANKMDMLVVFGAVGASLLLVSLVMVSQNDLSHISASTNKLPAQRRMVLRCSLRSRLQVSRIRQLQAWPRGAGIGQGKPRSSGRRHERHQQRPKRAVVPRKAQPVWYVIRTNVQRFNVSSSSCPVIWQANFLSTGPLSTGPVATDRFLRLTFLSFQTASPIQVYALFHTTSLSHQLLPKPWLALPFHSMQAAGHRRESLLALMSNCNYCQNPFQWLLVVPKRCLYHHRLLLIGLRSMITTRASAFFDEEGGLGGRRTYIFCVHSYLILVAFLSFVHRAFIVQGCCRRAYTFCRSQSL
jgi:farnesyl-diphosphate farnesyltransferase